MRNIFCFVITMLLTTGAAFAKGKSFLPIKQGIYVVASSSCVGAVYADIQGYYGDTLSAGHGGCKILSVSRKANAYRVKASCLQPQDDAKPETWISNWTILNSTMIKINDTNYRWCAADVSKLFREN